MPFLWYQGQLWDGSGKSRWPKGHYLEMSEMQQDMECSGQNRRSESTYLPACIENWESIRESFMVIVDIDGLLQELDLDLL